MDERDAENFRAHYEAGDRLALLQVILLAGMFREPIPDWAAEAFKEAYEHVMRGGASSWDDVFGKPHPKGKHLRSIQQDHLKYTVHATVRYLVEKERAPIDEGLFERVAQMMRIGQKTLISRLYYEAEDSFRRVGNVGPNPKGE